MNLQNQRQSGSILISVLLVCSVLTVGLASYLSFAQSQTASVVRSQTWNAAIPVCEAGIEEGLTHINDSVVGTNYAVNGWTIVSNRFQMQRFLGSNYYVVNISTDKFPILRCTGYVKIPGKTNQITRTVEGTTTRWATGMKGLITKYNITMTPQCEIDSFDSEDARYSTRGRYDEAKHKDGGFAGSVLGNVQAGKIAGSTATGPTGLITGNVGDFGWLDSSSGVQPGHSANDMNLAFPDVQVPFDGGAFTPTGGTLTLTNFDYWSTVITTDVYPSTPPPSGVVTNNFGTVVTTTYPSGVLAGLVTTNTTSTRTKYAPFAGTYINLNQQGAWYYYDKITSYSYPARTYTFSTTATNTSMVTASYTYILSASQYQMGALSLSGSQSMVVTGEDVTLYVTGDISFSGQSKLIIVPGASLKIYVAGNASFSGNGIFNYNLDASKLMLYGLPSSTSISISGNAAFTGCIYAPRADLTMNGGGNDTYDVVGATITKTATMNGHFHFHYDERLGRSPIQSKFTLAYWREV